MALEHPPFVPRQRTLTDADMAALAELLAAQHNCRFDNITREDMDFVKDLLKIYKETRSEVIKWVVKGAVYSILIVILVGAYLKLGSK